MQLNVSSSLFFNVADLFPYGNTFDPPILFSFVFVSTSSTLVHHAPTVLEPSDEILDVKMMSLLLYILVVIVASLFYGMIIPLL